MRRLTVLSLSLGLLILFGSTIRFAAGQAPQSRPAREVTLQIKDTPLSARRVASQTQARDLDLLQKGYVVIGSVSVDWRVNQSEVSEPGIPAAALVAEADRLMAEAAAAAGGDLIKIISTPGISVDYGTKVENDCTDITTRGRDVDIVSRDKYGTPHVVTTIPGKTKTTTQCIPAAKKDYAKPLYSMTAEATVWRMASEGDKAAIRAAEARRREASIDELESRIAALEKSLGSSQPPRTPATPAQKPPPPSQASSPANGPSGWQEYPYAEDRFSVSAPSKPDFQRVPQGTMEGHHYTINLDSTRSVLISVTDTKQGDKLQPKRALADAKDGFAKNLNLKIISEKEITLAEYPGIEFEGQSEQWRTRVQGLSCQGNDFSAHIHRAGERAGCAGNRPYL